MSSSDFNPPNKINGKNSFTDIYVEFSTQFKKTYVGKVTGFTSSSLYATVIYEINGPAVVYVNATSGQSKYGYFEDYETKLLLNNDNAVIKYNGYDGIHTLKKMFTNDVTTVFSNSYWLGTSDYAYVDFITLNNLNGRWDAKINNTMKTWINPN